MSVKSVYGVADNNIFSGSPSSWYRGIRQLLGIILFHPGILTIFIMRIIPGQLTGILCGGAGG